MSEVNLDEITKLLGNQISHASHNQEDNEEREVKDKTVEESAEEPGKCEGCPDCKCDDKHENREYKNPINDEYIIRKNNRHGAPVWKWPAEIARISDWRIV